jgi:hypothetical protein
LLLFAFICLVFFGGFGAFQRVAGEKIKKNSWPPPRRAMRGRHSSSRFRPIPSAMFLAFFI